MHKLIKLIEQWAIDRGLDKSGTVEGQFFKTAEEAAELTIGISKDDIDVIKDSIGDVFVTLVVGNLLDKQFDVMSIYDGASNNSTMRARRKIDLIHFLTKLLRMLLSMESYTSYTCGHLIECLLDVCEWYDLDFTDCVESAYNEISNRKGAIVNGTFIKEDDLV